MQRGILVGLALALGCGDDGAWAEEARVRGDLAECESALNSAHARIQELELGGALEPAAAAPEAVDAPEDPPAPESDADAPLVPLRAYVRGNSAGTTEVSISVRNESRKAIDGFRFSVQLFNAFNEPVRCRYGSPRLCRGGLDAFRGYHDGRPRLAPGSERRLGVWSAFDFPGATKGIVTITEVHFTDNSTWSGASRQEYDPREPERPAKRTRRARPGIRDDLREFVQDRPDPCVIAPNSDSCMRQLNDTP